MTDRTPAPGVDFGKRSSDYAEHRPGFPASFYDRLEAFVPLAGARALDVGTGPGIVALELARRGARVTGLDISEHQVAAAERRARDQGLAGRCDFRVRPVEDTGLEAARFELATAGQCWIWFDEARALAELSRVLSPGGVLAIAQFCYLPRHSALAAASEELVHRHNPDWTMSGHDGLYPRHIDAVIEGGFELLEQFCYDHDQPFTRASWRGRMRTCNGVGSGGMAPAEVEAFDRDLEQLLADRVPERFTVKHRVWAVVARRP